jgi:putative PIN family toxin of toxin-antitoxin system
MIRVVLDTNIVVSASLKEEGREAAVLSLALTGNLSLHVSEAILTEYEEVLHRKKFRLNPGRVDRLLDLIRGVSTLVTPSHVLSISPHEPDNRLLECADQAQADYLVTGNKRHFPKRWKGTLVVNARELLELITAGLKP